MTSYEGVMEAALGIVRDQRDEAQAEVERLREKLTDALDRLGAVSEGETRQAPPNGLSSLLDALSEMSKKYDVMFYPCVRYWEVARWIKAAQKGATFSVADKDGSKLLVWDKEGKEQDDER